jgi:hypothetical protein
MEVCRDSTTQYGGSEKCISSSPQNGDRTLVYSGDDMSERVLKIVQSVNWLTKDWTIGTGLEVATRAFIHHHIHAAGSVLHLVGT